MPPPRSPEKRYELVERIAVGGMAEVFRAKAYGPHGFEKVLAIKRILPGLAADPKFERRFIAEAKLAVSLSHANIVQVLDFSRFGQSLYIVMEYLDGGDLAGVLQALREREAPFPLNAAMHVGVELLKGLEFAHRRGVVHRDLSPSNILLSRAGEVKIGDFGIAQAVGFETSRSIRIMGKWRYMSPEQADGEEVDARSDVFSAGAVLFEVLTGQRLLPGSDPEEIVRNLRQMPLPGPSQVRPDLPAELDAPLAAALARDRDARITAGQLLSALVEVCYARALPALPTELASFLDDLSPPRDPAAAIGGELDRIIGIELAGERAIGTGGVRRTARALGPPELAPEDIPPEPSEPGRAPELTFAGATFIRSVSDRDGGTHWEAADGPTEGGLGAERGGGHGTVDGIARDGIQDRIDGAEVDDGIDGDGIEDRIDDDDEHDDGDLTLAVEAGPAETSGPFGAGPVERSDPFGAGPAERSGPFAAGPAERPDPFAADSLVPGPPAPGTLAPGTHAPSSAERSGPFAAGSFVPGSFAPGSFAPSSSAPDSLAPGRPSRSRRRWVGAGLAAAAAGLIALAARSSDPSPARDGSPSSTRASLPSAEPAPTRPESASAGAATPAPIGASPVGSNRVGSNPVAAPGEAAPPAPIGSNPAASHPVASNPVSSNPLGSNPVAPNPTAASGASTPAPSNPVPARRERTGTVDIYAEPWANIYLGRRKVGVAPQRGVRLPVGRHRLRLVNPVLGRSAWITVTVPAARPIRVILRAR